MESVVVTSSPRNVPSTSTYSVPTPTEQRLSAGRANIVVRWSARASQSARGFATAPPGGSHLRVYASLAPLAVRRTTLRSVVPSSPAVQASPEDAMSNTRPAAARDTASKYGYAPKRGWCEKAEAGGNTGSTSSPSAFDPACARLRLRRFPLPAGRPARGSSQTERPDRAGGAVDRHEVVHREVGAPASTPSVRRPSTFLAAKHPSTLFPTPVRPRRPRKDPGRRVENR
jgi:hypothetical protein